MELLGGKQTSLNLSQLFKKLTASKQKTITLVKNNKIIRVKLTKEETQSHREFVKGIKNAMWHKLDY